MITPTDMQHQAKEPALHLETSPIHIKGILVATDMSDQSTKVLKISAHLARQLHARLHVLHAIPPQVYVPGGAGLAPVLQEIDVQQAEAALHNYLARVGELRTLKHEEIVLSELVTDAISDAVESKGIDLVIMGSHGRSGLGKIVLGSNAEAAVRHLRCPALIVGPHSLTSHRSLKSIVLATKLPAESLRAAQYAMSIIKALGGSAHIVHVLPKAGWSADAIEVAKQAARAQLGQLVPADAEIARNVHLEVAVGNTAEQIIANAIACKAGLIVMGVHEDGILADHAPWATLSEVIHAAHCPVLAVRPHIS